MKKNQIEKELKKSETYMLKLNSDYPDLVEISEDNVARVEAILRIDSGFRKATDIENPGSSASSIMMFKQSWKSKNSSNYPCLIKQIVERLDSENKTHLNSDGVGRSEITDRINAIGMDALVEELKNPEENNYKLIKILAEGTHPTGKSKNGKAYKSRRNLSFASKFCHYMCFFLFMGEREQDNFSIYDSVVSAIIPRYLNYYGSNMALRKNNYVDYIRAIDEIILRSGSRISRNGLDHLLWFYHK